MLVKRFDHASNLAQFTLGGTAIISGTVSAGQTIAFAGSGGVLGLDNVPAFGAAISGFGTGDTLDLGNLACSFTLIGNYTTANFALSSGTTGETDVKFA